MSHLNLRGKCRWQLARKQIRPGNVQSQAGEAEEVRVMLSNMGKDNNMEEIKSLLRKFNEDRDWDQFHSPENLAKSVAIEAGELLECFQWGGEYKRSEVADEIADVVMYCIMLADKTSIDIEKEMIRKLDENAKKYPVEKAKGNSKKYTEL